MFLTREPASDKLSDMPTTKQQLIEHLYDGDLAGDIADFTRAGMSWREIAERVSARSGQSVSYETLRTWYGSRHIEAAS